MKTLDLLCNPIEGCKNLDELNTRMNSRAVALKVLLDTFSENTFYEQEDTIKNLAEDLFADVASMFCEINGRIADMEMEDK